MKIVLAMLFLVTSCASYINGIHRQIDREEAMTDPSNRLNDPYASYREQGFKKTKSDRRPIQNPNSLSNLNPTRDIEPPVKRDYRSANGRSRADDFIDDGASGSLWVNPQGGSLFTTEVTKRVGDIVIVNVLDNLRGQISSELKRSTPEPPQKKNPSTSAAAGAAATPAAPVAPEAEKTDELETKVYDKISGVVAEEINKDYVLLRGKKEVVFRKEKKLIEVQALVARKDIADNDTINSDKLLESRVIILR
ncbi:MAG: flagellar basal body L-ring protein FlgH [Bacteriovoracia bacterium]